MNKGEDAIKESKDVGPITVALEIGLTSRRSINLSWPHRHDLSADLLLSGPG